jgi:hypothetical protein
MIDYNYWNALSAQERIAHWNAVAELIQTPGTIELGSISSFILREQFSNSPNTFCGSCEEEQPSIMCWLFDDDDDLDDHKNPTLSKVVENLKVEDSICSWCVEEEVTRRVCVHCKKPGWHLRNPCLEGFEHQFEQTTDYDEVVA